MRLWSWVIWVSGLFAYISHVWFGFLVFSMRLKGYLWPGYDFYIKGVLGFSFPSMILKIVDVN